MRKRIKYLILFEIILLLAGVIGLISGEHVAAELGPVQAVQVETGTLSPGVYRLEISAAAEAGAVYSVSISAASGRFRGIRSNTMSFGGGEDVAVGRFYVTGRGEEAVIALSGSGTEELRLEELRIVKTNAGSRIFLTAVIVLSAAVNALLLLYSYLSEHPAPPDKKLAWAGVLVIGLVASYPVFTDYILESMTTVFSASSRSVLLLLPTALYRLGFDMMFCCKGYILAVNFATAAIACGCFGRIFRNGYAGLLGSILYTLAPARLDCIYENGSVGAYTAAVFFPLLFLGLYLILRENRDREADSAGWLLWAVGFSGILQAHIPSALAAVCCSLLLCLLCLKRVFCKGTRRALLKLAGWSLLLNAWFPASLPGGSLSGEAAGQSAGGGALETAAAACFALAVCAVFRYFFEDGSFAGRAYLLLAGGGSLLYAMYRTNEFLLESAGVLRLYSADAVECFAPLRRGPWYWYACGAVSAASLFAVLFFAKKRHKRVQ